MASGGVEAEGVAAATEAEAVEAATEADEAATAGRWGGLEAG
jgi:hypothetical protein